MLYVESTTLYFFLLVLEISLNFKPDTGHKHNRFSKTLLKKDFKFVLSRRDNTIVFNLSFILLLIQNNPNLKEQSYKKNMLVAYDTGRIKIVLVLLTKVITLYIQVFIV